MAVNMTNSLQKNSKSYRRHHGCEHEEQHAEEQHGCIVVNFASFIACNKNGITTDKQIHYTVKSTVYDDKER
jgi:hypothetical protein